MRFRNATPKDVPQIRGLEAEPAYRTLIGSWPEEQHLKTLAEPDALYIVAEDEQGRIAAFAFLQGLQSEHRSVELKRIVVRIANQGIGRKLLNEVAELRQRCRRHALFCRAANRPDQRGTSGTTKTCVDLSHRRAATADRVDQEGGVRIHADPGREQAISEYALETGPRRSNRNRLEWRLPGHVGSGDSQRPGHHALLDRRQLEGKHGARHRARLRRAQRRFAPSVPPRLVPAKVPAFAWRLLRSLSWIDL